MKIKIFFTLFFIAFSLCINAQKQYSYPFFPNDQHCYLGGFSQLYKDFNKILIDDKIKACENKKEFLTAFVLIRNDNSIEVLENNSSQENKCSYEITKEVMKKMDKWIPAKINGEEKPTIARVLIYMDDLFEKYNDSYNIGKIITKSSFDIVKFRDDVVKRVDL